MKSPVVSAGTLVSAWQGGWANLVAVAILLCALGWYLKSARARRWPALKVISFAVGIVVALYALDGGIASYDQDNFSAHVAQLLLLFGIAPPLVSLGEPVRLALQTLRGGRSALLARALATVLARWLVRPLVGLGFGTALMYVYFLTPLYGVSARHPESLVAVGIVIFIGGCLAWWPVVGRDAICRQARFGPRFAVLALSVPLNAFLGIEIANLAKPLYPAGNTLSDTRGGGDLLWALAVLLIVAGAALLFVEWARQEERDVARADRQLDAALAVARQAQVQEESQGRIEAASASARSSLPGADV